ncbi:MAG: DNA gyrase inhibitor YacG [Bdellovibrionota bacterium]
MDSGSKPSKPKDENVRTVTCPQCRKPAIYSSENPYRPFCSERCRLIDLGAWASEDYKVPTPVDPNDLNPETPDENEDEDASH